MSDATARAGSPPCDTMNEKPGTANEERKHKSTSEEGEGERSFGAGDQIVEETKEDMSGDSEIVGGEGKQKRKRTSPQDQAVLESEYKQNPKPNKAARADIVEKVSLNEKEVQIWFQNRRQINRRKSRPLLPHEIAAFGLGGMAAFSSDPIQFPGLSSSQGTPERGHNSQVDVAGSQEEEPQHSMVEISTPQQHTMTSGIVSEMEENPESVQCTRLPQLKQGSFASSLNRSSSFSGPDSVVKSFMSSPGYLANRWNTINSSLSTPSASQQPSQSFVTPNISQSVDPASCPGRLERTTSSSSKIRLSMSLDGKAELVTTSPTSSPPRDQSHRPSSPLASFDPPAKRMRTLERSQSALPSYTLGSASAIFPTLGRGRSRDARTWQICCDGDVRDELTAQAEREAGGSAIAAIGLLRSASNSALKSARTAKRNPQVASKQDTNKPGKKPQLGRAQSSLARLQYSHKTHEHLANIAKEGLMRSPSGDSDKENWLPGEPAVNTRRRPLPKSKSDKFASSRSILGDNHTVPTHATNLGGGRSRKRKSQDAAANIFEDVENAHDASEGGEEVQKFMRGEVSPSKKGDLDCIQGLLSLSQGNWR